MNRRRRSQLEVAQHAGTSTKQESEWGGLISTRERPKVLAYTLDSRREQHPIPVRPEASQIRTSASRNCHYIDSFPNIVISQSVSMSNHIILSTASASLKIESKSVGTSLKISRYREFLMIKQKEDKSISEVELELKDETNEKIITTMRVPSRIRGNSQRIRIDALFPLIFQNGEEIRIITTPTLSDIYSGKIQVETTIVSVSKEILSISSECFTQTFYGNFKENEKEIKLIKSELPEEDFVRFMIMMHKRKFKLESVEMGIIALWFANYYQMTEVISKAVSFLLNKDLPEDLLSRGLELADRVSYNTAILEWVLKNIPDTKKFFQVLHDSIPIISKQTTQMCLTDQLGIRLGRWDGDDCLDRKYFAIPIIRPTPSRCHQLQSIRIAIDDIWPHVPIGMDTHPAFERLTCESLALRGPIPSFFGSPSAPRAKDDANSQTNHLVNAVRNTQNQDENGLLKEEKPFNEVQLELRDDLNEMLITSMNIPSTTLEPEQRVRIDALFPLRLAFRLIDLSSQQLFLSGKSCLRLHPSNSHHYSMEIITMMKVSEDNVEFFMNIFIL
ncbi:hypothetical protein PRIPAC_83174 [Pristionchus pacificus]|uniref:BTB domain-containing protein n=1 Tax=Pristionchus pacificus TaxID=54126 RepID=A0A2A6BLT9_PRIPA|nr:hypothetical protein PRIPAC_83174 [Pristionchus pacificus]|eukprot:PDM66875.1 BTB domain-containing protein [Pristionchus pacificus]